jgi:hypothetical protein
LLLFHRSHPLLVPEQIPSCTPYQTHAHNPYTGASQHVFNWRIVVPKQDTFISVNDIIIPARVVRFLIRANVSQVFVDLNWRVVEDKGKLGGAADGTGDRTGNAYISD